LRREKLGYKPVRAIDFDPEAVRRRAGERAREQCFEKNQNPSAVTQQNCPQNRSGLIWSARI